MTIARAVHESPNVPEFPNARAAVAAAAGSRRAPAWALRRAVPRIEPCRRVDPDTIVGVLLALVLAALPWLAVAS